MPGLGILDRRGNVSETRIGIVPEKLRYESGMNFGILDTLRQRIAGLRERFLKR